MFDFDLKDDCFFDLEGVIAKKIKMYEDSERAGEKSSGFYSTYYKFRNCTTREYSQIYKNDQSKD